MVSNRIAQQARRLMAQHPGLRYQQALDQVRSANHAGVPATGMLAALGIHELESFDPRPAWRETEWDSHFRFPIGFSGPPGAPTGELEIPLCREASQNQQHLVRVGQVFLAVPPQDEVAAGVPPALAIGETCSILDRLDQGLVVLTEVVLECVQRWLHCGGRDGERRVHRLCEISHDYRVLPFARPRR